jgi:hypothetical protein
LQIYESAQNQPMSNVTINNETAILIVSCAAAINQQLYALRLHAGHADAATLTPAILADRFPRPRRCDG